MKLGSKFSPMALVLVLSVFAQLMSIGCSGALPAVKPPKIDTQAAAEDAIAEFDDDQNGSVEKGEACFGIRSQWARYDGNGDDSISQEEFAARFGEWTNGDTYTSIEVYRDGALLATIGGGMTMYSDVFDVPGDYLYGVKGYVGADASPASRAARHATGTHG